MIPIYNTYIRNLYVYIYNLYNDPYMYNPYNPYMFGLPTPVISWFIHPISYSSK